VELLKNINRYSIYTAVHFALTLCYRPLYGEEILHSQCRPPWDVEKISDCAISNHPSFKLESLRLKEIQGRKKIANYFFPTNPNVSSYVSNRSASGPSNILSTSPAQASNFQLMVTQEIFVGGKREKSIQIADEEFRSQVFRLEAVRRNIHFQTMSSIIRYINAKKEETICLDLYNLAQNLTRLAQARVKEGIAPGMDETLAESEELRMAKIWKNSHRRVEQMNGEVHLLLSLAFVDTWTWNPSIGVNLQIPTDKESLLNLALANRPEINLTEKEIKLAMLRYEEVRLQKIPNLSFGAFVQNDGFNERVVGGQVSMPLTVWRDFEGESLVARARGEQAIESREIVSRTVKQEVINALSNYFTLKEEFALYDDTILTRTNADLNHITEALRLGKIKIIDAINSQRVLVQTRLNYIQTKTDYELAQVELIRALGLPTDQLILREQQ
jgi:cobalt-zinc-cadmium efflux system outer membrane protein